MEFLKNLETEIDEHLDVMNKIRSSHLNWVVETGNILFKAFENGHKVLVAGNGGSAADSQHFAAELVGRYVSERKSLPAIALTTDTSALTAIANDYHFENIFSRQLEGLGAPGDVFVAISTSGNSPNTIKALKTARQNGMITISLLGKTGGPMKTLSDHALVVPSKTTARIQEAHEWVLHSWCALVDHCLEKANG